MNASTQLTRTRTGTALRLLRRSALVLAVMVVALTTTSPGASAHAELQQLSPADGSELARAPRSLTLTFNEAVAATKSSIELLDARGKVLASNRTEQVSTTHSLRTPTLRKGHYVLRWAVTSADGHPVVAAAAFSVGVPTRSGKAVPLQLTGVDGSAKGRLDAAKVGRRSITLPAVSGEGTVELRHPAFKAPLVWELNPSGADLVATGLLPAPGNWRH